jgi:hypothetical protein
MRWLTERGLTDPTAFGGAGGSLSKLSWSTIDQALGDLAVDILGMDGLSDRWAHNLVSVRQSSIAGGTTVINRNLVAEDGVGLPRWAGAPAGHRSANLTEVSDVGEDQR